MIKANYYLRDKNKLGETPIILYVSYKGQRKKFSTGINVNPKYWNETSKRLRLKNGDKTRDELNDKLEKWEGDLKEEIRKIRFRGESDYNFDSISDIVNKILNSDSVKTLKVKENESKDEVKLNSKPGFFQVYDQFIEDSKNGLRMNDKGHKLTKASIQKYERTRDILKEFSKIYPISFEAIDLTFYRSFISFLNKYKVKKKTEEEKIESPKGGDYIIGFKINTVGKFIRTIKAFMNYATEIGANTSTAFMSKKFKAFNEEVDNISLTEAEVNEIYKLDLSENPELTLSRDLFVIGCWTGLRFEDLTTVKDEYIDGNMLTIPSYSKVGKKVTIPLNDTVIELLKKYGGHWPERMRNADFNKDLKLIAKRIPSLNKLFIKSITQGGIKIEECYQKHELVTAHTARRTFATIQYLKGVPIQLIMNITGHKKESTFLRYINVSAEEHANKLKSYWEINM